MINSKNWTEIYLYGRDYLDKPPLHFWLSGISMKFLGISSFSYKLPSFLATLVGVWSTYKIGKLLYNKEVGRIASLIYYTSFTIILANQDVRTDSLLTSAIIFSVWQIFAFTTTKSWINLICGFFGVGLAMLSKGPIGFIIPLSAIFTHLLINRNWRELFNWKWIIGLLITTLTITPYLIGLYYQFDNQPDKEVTLSSNVVVQNYSGIRFYLWDQSFGRILGGNPEKWDNGLGPLFFTHTFLWAFFPWTIIGLISLFNLFKKIFIDKAYSEWITLSGIFFPFIIISIASYKLPHYINPIIPFISILAAVQLSSSHNHRTILVAQKIISIISILVTLIVILVVAPLDNILIGTGILILTILILIFIFKSTVLNSTIALSCLSISLISFTLNYQFIPYFSTYNGAYQAARQAQQLNLATVYTNNITQSLSFDIYFDGELEDLIDVDTTKGEFGIYVYEDMFQYINETFSVDTTYIYYNREISNLTLPFLMKESRLENVDIFYLFVIKSK